MQTDTAMASESGHERTSTAELSAVARRTRLARLGCVLALAAIFFFGAWSWVDFYRESGGVTGLFTQTDFPAVTIASRLVAEGHGKELYNLDAQLREQRNLISQGYLAL